MTYRSIDTATWRDTFFENLRPNAKLLFIYLWTNEVCNQAGLYKISKRRIEFEVGFQIDDIIEELKPKIIVDLKNDVVWVKNFFKRQCANPKFVAAALKSIQCVENGFKREFLEYNKKTIKRFKVDPGKFGLDTVCIPYTDSIDTDPLSGTGTGTDTGTEKILKKGTASPPSKDEIEDASIIKIKNDIDDIAEKLYQEKIFPKVHSFKNKFLKNGQNPRAILHALSRCYLKKTFKEDPWSYCVKILQIENGNYNERDFNKTS